MTQEKILDKLAKLKRHAESAKAIGTPRGISGGDRPQIPWRSTPESTPESAREP